MQLINWGREYVSRLMLTLSSLHDLNYAILKTTKLQLRTLFSPILLVFLPQFSPQDLAAGILRNDLNEFNTAHEPFVLAL